MSSSGATNHETQSPTDVNESTPLLNSENVAITPSWPRNRELGWLMPYGLKYPPPTLPLSLRGLQADLDLAWMELERQHVIVNRVNLVSSSLAILITGSGGITTAMAHSPSGKIWATAMGTLTTLAGTILGGIRASGQPRRAEDRVRRLERIIDHIGRLYYSVGQNGQVSNAVEETWKMIDDEEAQTEREERKKSYPYQNIALSGSKGSIAPVENPDSGSFASPGDSSSQNRAKPRTFSKLLGKDRLPRPRLQTSLP